MFDDVIEAPLKPLSQPYMAGRIAWIVGRERRAPSYSTESDKADWLRGYDAVAEETAVIDRLAP